MTPKPLDAFDVRKSTGRPYGQCQECRSRHKHEWYVANAKSIKQKQKLRHKTYRPIWEQRQQEKTGLKYSPEWEQRRKSRFPMLYTHRAMMSRCYNPKHDQYKDYGGRGITVDPCLQKLSDYQQWFESAFGLKRPPAGVTVDRIDNDGNYTPSNLRLATKEQQSANRRSKASLAS